MLINQTTITGNVPEKTIDRIQLPQPVLVSHPEWVELYHYAWERAAAHIGYSRGRFHMDAAWDPGCNFQWVWDTCFMALYCRYSGGEYPGVESLDNFYELQRADGYISMTYDMDTGVEPWPDRINPPLFAWVEWDHYLITGDASRFTRAVAAIEKFMGWIDANRRNQPHRKQRAADGPPEGRGESEDVYSLYYFEDGGSSGMDDSPRAPRLHEAGQMFDWVDLSSQMVLSFRMLARMQAVLGNRMKSEHWEARACELGDLINSELWAEKTKFYHDRYVPKNFLGHKTVAGFWPMVAGFCPPDRVEALVAHLLDKREFNRPTPIPTLSADDVNYSPQGRYWLGGVWAPTNYMITRGLVVAGYGDLAHDIACRYLGVLAQTYATVEPHALWEAYSPEESKPGLEAYTEKRVRPDYVGWTGLGPIAMLIENVLGLEVCAPERRVTWDIRLLEQHGIRNLSIGDGKIDLVCAARFGKDSPATVELCSTIPCAVVLRRGPITKKVTLSSGDTKTLVV